MKTIYSTLLFTPLLCIALLASAQKAPAIIPEPVSMQLREGHFQLPEQITIAADGTGKLASSVDLLTRRLSAPTGFQVKTGPAADAEILLELNKTTDERLGREGYRLLVSSDKITITANQAAGIYYGVQSLLQLLPPQIQSEKKVKPRSWNIPAVEILDYPKVGWRGLMLDVSRHFFTLDEVKQYIDAMVQYKYNRLHFHLTDDEGWRLEIKSLPKLTEVGAWRVNKTGTFGNFSKPLPDEPKDYGGFYTQDQIRDLIRYAKERFVEIVPEIDVPGHSLAAVAAYPELSCTPGADQYNVRSGEAIMDWSHGAPPIALVDNTLCPANEKVYQFMDKVITEVAALFPFEYIHLGGDEAPHNFWEKNPQVQALMKKENLKTIPQVQSYFEKRVEKIVQKKGKKMMGWDELLEGGVSSSTAIMSWRGEQAGIEASNQQHYVVMSPTSFAYIDYVQGDASLEAPVYATLRLSKAYQFNPIPKGANAKYILGGQANLWTEQIYNIRYAEYMTWPRGFAIAESLWSPESKKDWNHFVSKTEQHFKRFRQAGINFAPSMYDPAVAVKKLDSLRYSVTLTPEIAGLDIHYSFDNSPPDNYYPKYTEPLIIPKDASRLRVITYKGDRRVGRMMNLEVADLKKRVRP